MKRFNSSAEHRPDVTLMDLRMPDISGIDALIAILAEFPSARIVMLTTFEGDVEIQRALAAGARGYLLKNMPRRSWSRRSARCMPDASGFPARSRRSSPSTSPTSA